MKVISRELCCKSLSKTHDTLYGLFSLYPYKDITFGGILPIRANDYTFVCCNIPVTTPPSLPDMRFRAPRFLRRLMPSLVWNIESPDGVYITFDDGPTPGNTEWIIDTLAKYDAKATFFCLGKNAEQHPETFRKIIEAGHAVGNHTYSHQKGWSMSLRRYVEDVDFAAQFIPGYLFRPPYGRIKPSQARVLDQRYNIIMWDVLSHDYSPYISRRQCAKNVIRYVRPGSIIVFHDSPKSSRNMRYALPRVLEHIQKMGLQCLPIEL